MGPLDERFETLAEALKASGYQTGAVVGALVLDSRFGLHQGFEAYDDEVKNPSSLPSVHFAERSAAAVTDAALGWLGGVDGGRRYFLWVHYFDPHMPYAPPGLPPGTLNQAAYDQEIVYTDEQLGRLMTEVERRRERTGRETLILFMADHGESLLEHGEPTHAFFVYDVTIRVPLIVSIPGVTPGGSTVVEPVSLVDLYPSVLHWLGIRAPYRVDGAILPVTNETTASERRVLYFESLVPFHFYGWSPLEGVVVDRHKFILAPREELYDLVEDPLEERNLVYSQAERLASLREALDSLKEVRLDAPEVGEAGLTGDAESIRALRALGYAGEIREPPSTPSGLADPKDMIAVHVDLTSAATNIEEGDFEAACADIERGLRRDLDNPRGLRILTEILDHPNASRYALELTRQRLEKPLPEPFDVRLPIALGLAWARAGRGAEGVALLQAMVERRPASAELHHGLGLVLLSVDQTDRAAVELRAAIEADSSFRPAREALGDLLSRTGQFESAAEQYAAAAGLGESKADIHAKWGEALHRGGRPNEARQQFERAIELDAMNVDAHVGLAELAAARGDRSAAIVSYERAAAAKPDDATLRYSAGVAHLEAEHWPEAVGYLREAIRLQPDYGDAMINLGVALFKNGESAEAIETLRRATAIAGVAAQANFNLGIALNKQQRQSEALAAFEKAIELQPTHEAAIEELSGAYLAGGRIAEAVRILRIAATNFPGTVRYSNTLAQILASSRRDDVRDGAEAVRFAEQARRAAGQPHPSVLATLGAAYAESGEFERAVAAAEQALSLARAGGQSDLVTRIEGQLAGYRAGRPYRDPRF